MVTAGIRPRPEQFSKLPPRAWEAGRGCTCRASHPRLAGHGPTLFAGLSKPVDLKLVRRLTFGPGAVVVRYEGESMSEVGKVTIQTGDRGGRTIRRISATVNVGGSLVEVHLDSEQDHELQALVDQLNARLRSLALQTIQASFKPEER